jgi:hypothetical protein
LSEVTSIKHSKRKQAEISHEASLAVIVAHIADRINVDTRRNNIDNAHHDHGQLVNAQGPINAKIARGYPRHELSKHADHDPSPPIQNKLTEAIAAKITPAQVIIWAGTSPIFLPKIPVIRNAARGEKTAKIFHVHLPLQRGYILNRDGTLVAEENHQNRKTDGSLCRCHRQDKHGKDLPHQIAQEPPQMPQSLY